ncbi:MAG: hypothetical protein ACI8WB_000288 [Phenylobacterium sp.]|jgi:hypothetical protein
MRHNTNNQPGRFDIWRFTVVLLSLLIASCTTQVEVEGNFPRPVINQLPLSVGVHYPAEFADFSYVEQSDDRSGRDIGIGKAQVKLFATVLPALFREVVAVAKPEQGQAAVPVDLILTMKVDDFQYTVPKETKVDMYEVWIKYNMQLFDSQGQLIADWILTAYGKTPSAMLQTEGSALNAAMVVALRDAGASFSLSFTKVPEIKQWLEQRRRSII